MKKGLSEIILAILILLIAVAITSLVALWLPKLTFNIFNIESSFNQSYVRSRACLSLESVDAKGKILTVKNCGKVALTNFTFYVDSKKINLYLGGLQPQESINLSYAESFATGYHNFFITSDYAESQVLEVYYIYSGPCDFFIYQSNMTNTYSITQSNKLYCLAENVQINGQNAINFSSGVHNSTLDCQGYNINGNSAVHNSAVYLTGSSTKNNTIYNCNITNFWDGIYLNSGPSNNTMNNCNIINIFNGIHLNSSSNNIITNNIITNGDISIWLDNSPNNIVSNNVESFDNHDGIFIAASNNNIITNNIAYNNLFGIAISSSYNNSITGGSEHNNTLNGGNAADYYLDSSGTTNNFTNTNFTDIRNIFFDISASTSWFNYANDTSGLWLKMNIPSGMYIKVTRKLISWSQKLIQWNDTTTASSLVYNISGLSPNSQYRIFQGTQLLYTQSTTSSGELSFTINGGSGYIIRVEPSNCQFFINSLPYNVTQNNTYYCLNTSSTSLVGTAIQFGNSSSWAIQNSTLDCQVYSMNGDGSGTDYGVYLTGSSTKNNTIYNCNITNFWDGIYLNSGPSNNTLNNNIVANNSQYGIFLSTSSNNVISNNIVINHSFSGIEIDNSLNNSLLNNIASFDSAGIYNWYSNYTTINNNIANNNSVSGISTYRSSNIFIANNTASGNAGGIVLNSINNTVTGGSFHSNPTYDYYLSSAGTNNNFTNTNFTAPRTIYFGDAFSWFNYQNDTSNLWLKTNVSASSNITRKLVNWSNSLMQWNDTSNNAITARYNITGLLTSASYNVYNNSVLITGSPFTSDFNGQISFAINLPANQELNITVVLSSYSLNSTNSTTAGTPIGFSLYWQSNIGLSNAITSLWNGSSWVNASSWCSIGSTSGWCNQTMVVNSTPQQLWWKQYANDTLNNWITSQNFSLFTTTIGGLEFAQYNSTLKAPDCHGGSPCIANSSLLQCNDDQPPSLGPEPNSPNTIDSCADSSSSGTCHSDESVENITIESTTHNYMGQGDTVRVNVTYYCYGTTDYLALWYTNSTSSINWIRITPTGITCSSGGYSTYSWVFTLNNTASNQAVRGIIEYGQNIYSSCEDTSFTDRDDLAFDVK